MTVQGSGLSDVELKVDYSETFYRPELILEAPVSGGDEGSETDQALRELAHVVPPTSVDFTKKMETVYLFVNIPAGTYRLKL